jgi:hypothetical protein
LISHCELHDVKNTQIYEIDQEFRMQRRKLTDWRELWLVSEEDLRDVSTRQMDATILADNEEVSAGTNERRRQ